MAPLLWRGARHPAQVVHPHVGLETTEETTTTTRSSAPSSPRHPRKRQATEWVGAAAVAAVVDLVPEQQAPPTRAFYRAGRARRTRAVCVEAAFCPHTTSLAVRQRSTHGKKRKGMDKRARRIPRRRCTARAGARTRSSRSRGQVVRHAGRSTSSSARSSRRDRRKRSRLCRLARACSGSLPKAARPREMGGTGWMTRTQRTTSGQRSARPQHRVKACGRDLRRAPAWSAHRASGWPRLYDLGHLCRLSCINITPLSIAFA